ncbi:unnamed protein product [Amoebophrya sp. A120]|nr:unnamed protein product [Amoebophrya sp. A120]|eukprot:GSA120T00016566001.1
MSDGGRDLSLSRSAKNEELSSSDVENKQKAPSAAEEDPAPAEKVTANGHHEDEKPATKPAVVLAPGVDPEVMAIALSWNKTDEIGNDRLQAREMWYKWANANGKISAAFGDVWRALTKHREVEKEQKAIEERERKKKEREEKRKAKEEAKRAALAEKGKVLLEVDLRKNPHDSNLPEDEVIKRKMADVEKWIPVFEKCCKEHTFTRKLPFNMLHLSDVMQAEFGFKPDTSVWDIRGLMRQVEQTYKEDPFFEFEDEVITRARQSSAGPFLVWLKWPLRIDLTQDPNKYQTQFYQGKHRNFAEEHNPDWATTKAVGDSREGFEFSKNAMMEQFEKTLQKMCDEGLPAPLPLPAKEVMRTMLNEKPEMQILNSEFMQTSDMLAEARRRGYVQMDREDIIWVKFPYTSKTNPRPSKNPRFAAGKLSNYDLDRGFGKGKGKKGKYEWELNRKDSPAREATVQTRNDVDMREKRSKSRDRGDRPRGGRGRSDSRRRRDIDRTNDAPKKGGSRYDDAPQSTKPERGGLAPPPGPPPAINKWDNYETAKDRKPPKRFESRGEHRRGNKMRDTSAPRGGRGGPPDNKRRRDSRGAGGRDREEPPQKRRREDSRERKGKGKGREDSRERKGRGKGRDDSRDRKGKGKGRDDSRDRKGKGKGRDDSRDRKGKGKDRDDSRDRKGKGKQGRDDSRDRKGKGKQDRDTSRGRKGEMTKGREKDRDDSRDRKGKGKNNRSPSTRDRKNRDPSRDRRPPTPKGRGKDRSESRGGRKGAGAPPAAGKDRSRSRDAPAAARGGRKDSRGPAKGSGKRDRSAPRGGRSPPRDRSPPRNAPRGGRDTSRGPARGREPPAREPARRDDREERGRRDEPRARSERRGGSARRGGSERRGNDRDRRPPSRGRGRDAPPPRDSRRR